MASETQKELVFWNVQVTKSLDDAVEDAVKKGSFVTKSDLIRVSVREKLEELGVKINFGESEQG